MTRILLLYSYLFLLSPIYGQIAYDFQEISSLDQSKWLGDLEDFIINENEELQLFAAEEGESMLFHKTNIPDSMEILLSFKMDFSPSKSNKLRIYLMVDTTSIEQASGYFVEIGENGSGDKISFYRIIEGESLKLGEGSEGLFSSDPCIGKIKISRSAEGLWTVSVATEDQLLYEEEFQLFDSTIHRHFDQYFGIHCFYTSTRKDKFFFDDIYLKESVPDNIPPKLLQLKVLTTNRIFLEFDEILEKNSVMDLNNYTLVEENSHPQNVFFNEYKANQVEIEFDESFKSNTIYELKMDQISDLQGNRLQGSLYRDFYLSEYPGENDLKISEVLFNPFEEGSDFVEIYNHSSKILNLGNIIVRNNSRSSPKDYYFPDLDLFPGQYFAFSKDTFSLHKYYLLENNSNLFQMELPPFNNDEGNVSILSPLLGRKMIDSFDYEEDMHFELIQDTKGISLERISFEMDSNVEGNWHSAGTIFGGASPGYKNTQYLAKDSIFTAQFELVNELFSPDQDGHQDLLAIRYNLEKEACVATIRAFDISGQINLKIVNNQLIGREGVIFWDGLNEAGHYLPTGPYIIHCSYFHADGSSYACKLLCYLVEKL